MTGAEAAAEYGARRFRHMLTPFPRAINQDVELAEFIAGSPDGGRELVDAYCFGQAVTTLCEISLDYCKKSNDNYGGEYLHGSIPFGD